MAKPNIKTGGYANNNNNIRTSKSTGVNTGHNNTIPHNTGKFSDNLSGWIGEPNTNSTTDTGIEAANVAVLPATKKVVGNAVNKVVDVVVDKATTSIAAPKRYKISPLRQKEPTGRERIGNAIKTGIKITYRRAAAPRRYTNHTSSGIKTRRQNIPSGRVRVGNAIKTGRKVTYRHVAVPRIYTNHPSSGIKTHPNIPTGRERVGNAIKTGRKVTYRKPDKVKRAAWNKSKPPKSSNAQIDKCKVSDTGFESIQGVRTSRDKVRNAAHIGKNIAMATGAAATIMTGRYINEHAKMSLKGNAFQGNTSFKRLYTSNAKIDKQSTTNTGTDVIQGTRIAIKTGRNVVVGVKNTIKGAKKTYTVGRKIYTKTKTVVRNTSKTIKAIKNAKSAVDKVRLAAKAIVNTVKAIIHTIKALANPLVLKGLAIIAAVLLIIVIISIGVQAMFSIINSNFGWLYNPSDPTQMVDTVLDGHKTKIVGFINAVNTDYTNTKNNHSGYLYGLDDAGSEYSVKADTYKDILAILIVQKQKLHGVYGDTDPNGVYDLLDVKFKDNEIKDVLKRFYTMSTRSGTHYCSGCDCNGHSHSFPSCYKKICTTNHTHTSSCYTLNCSSSHYCSGCICPSGHSALYVKIINHSKESVMATFGFTPEEVERATIISLQLDAIEAGNF
jgi:hypothetical protein